MKSVLILCNSDPSCDPRPNRMARCLKDTYSVTVAGRARSNIEGVADLIIPAMLPKLFMEKLMYTLNLKLHRFEKILWMDEIQKTRGSLLENSFDLVIAHDLLLLPLALAVKKGGKVLLDAREYYPQHFEDTFKWRFFLQELNKYLCSTYLNRCDKMITVCDELAGEYERRYRVNAEVIMSLPLFHNLSPSLTNPDKIRLIHHGSAGASRRIEVMIEMMDYVDERFILDLMLVPDRKPYFEKLVSIAEARRNVRIIPPVKYEDVVPFTNQYDIGTFLVPPSTLNLKYTLPNKLFEFIQARLAVAIGPSIEMKKIVDKYDCGIVSDDFSPRSLAEKLNKLKHEDITFYKNQSDKATHELSAENNCVKIKGIVKNLIGE